MHNFIISQNLLIEKYGFSVVEFRMYSDQVNLENANGSVVFREELQEFFIYSGLGDHESYGFSLTCKSHDDLVFLMKMVKGEDNV